MLCVMYKKKAEEYYREFTQQYEYENHCKSLYLLFLLKTSFEI
jgi:hypothetical protein